MNPLNPLYTAVAWVFVHIHSVLALIISPGSGAAWALSIAILVVLMRLILVPLFVKQMHATRKMAALAPQLQELRKKYKNDKQKLNEETMALYRRNGANPLAGCLPLVAQLPLFFALFSVLRAISQWHPGRPVPYGMPLSSVVSAQHADILGATISDRFLFSSTTPLHARLVILGFVVISVATTFMTIRQSTKRGMTPQMTPDNPMAASQKYMQYIVPVFALSGLYWQFGLVLYWVTTNLWTLGQQYVLFKRYPPPATAAAQGTAAAGSGAAPGGGRGGGRTGGGRGGAQGKPGAQPRRDGRPGAEPSANGGGVLRRLGRTRAEPEQQQPAEPPAKLVRQQPQRQSRSKRSGKR